MTNTALFGVSTAWLLTSAWSVLSALLVLIIGWTLAGFLSGHVASLLPPQARRDGTIVPLLSQIVRYGIILVTLIIVLGQFGVETASILAVLGAAGLAIALALQGTLSNISAGILLVFLRPFNVGDFIDADGISGTVMEVGLFATQLRTYEGVFLFAPNSRLSNAKILNYTREASRVVEIKFNVPRSVDLDHVRSTVSSALHGDYLFSGTKADVQVDTLSDANITMVARIPVASRQWWDARSDLQEQLKRVLEEQNNFAPQTA